jgi:hypothetical protein
MKLAYLISSESCCKLINKLYEVPRFKLFSLQNTVRGSVPCNLPWKPNGYRNERLPASGGLNVSLK